MFFKILLCYYDLCNKYFSKNDYNIKGVSRTCKKIRLAMKLFSYYRKCIFHNHIIFNDLKFFDELRYELS